MCKPFFAFLCKMYSKFMFFELRKPSLDVFLRLHLVQTAVVAAESD